MRGHHGSIGVESNQDPQGEQTEKKQLKVLGFASKNTHTHLTLGIALDSAVYQIFGHLQKQRPLGAID